MSVDVSPQVTISRPRDEVAAFMFDPRNDALWTTGVVESRPLTEGLLRTGSRVERVSKFLGRQFGYLVEVTGHTEGRLVEMRVTEPFPMRIRYELEDCADGTVARIRAQGEAGGFFKLAAPFLSRMVRRSITNDLENLKGYLEARAQTS
ncbi:MAG: SRPBCC family protein [Myxococcaceae bacterium]|nr:SRPBCC family protein [Myxococcaceae bacterium]MCI0673387.1 SRPBCC family protein [Myxococcaceae bacterium]